MFLAHDSNEVVAIAHDGASAMLTASCTQCKKWDMRVLRRPLSVVSSGREIDDVLVLDESRAIIVEGPSVRLIDWRKPSRAVAGYLHSTDVTASSRLGHLRFASAPLLFADDDGLVVTLSRDRLEKMPCVTPDGSGRVVAVGVDWITETSAISASMDGNLTFHKSSVGLAIGEPEHIEATAAIERTETIVGFAPSASHDGPADTNHAMPECMEVAVVSPSAQEGSSSSSQSPYRVVVGRSDGVVTIAQSAGSSHLDVVMESPVHATNSVVGVTWMDPAASVLATAASSGEVTVWRVASSPSEEGADDLGLSPVVGFDIRGMQGGGRASRQEGAPSISVMAPALRGPSRLLVGTTHGHVHIFNAEE